jgi:hypothetical protein
MGNNEIHRRIMNFRFKRRRTVGRPTLQWTDGVLEDLRTMGISVVVIHQGYKSCNTVLWEARTYTGL